MNELPPGYTFKKGRALVSVIDPDGNPILHSLSEERALAALPCLPEFGGVISSAKQKEDYVEL